MTIVYPLIVLSTLASTLGFTAIFLAPKFAKIFEDFDITLPQLTLDVLMVGEYVGAPAMFLGGLIIALVFICSLWQLANQPMRRNLAMELALRAAWWFPVIRSQQKNRGLADVFETLADALDAGHPIPRALDYAQCLMINPVLQDRVASWRRWLESGVSLDVAARQAGLPAVAVSMLHSAQAAGNLPQACRFLARHFRGKFSRVSALIRGGLVPAIVIFLAVIVGVVVYALFLPLVSLIEATVAASM